MTTRTIKARIKRIQSHLGVPADGLIGPATLTALEDRLFADQATDPTSGDHALTVSRAGLRQLVRHEISSAAYYRKFLSHPTWPGGRSGVTIGIGYDLGYNTRKRIRDDWSGHLGELDLERLLVVRGLKGEAAKQAVTGVKEVEIPLDQAERVFYTATLPRYASLTRKTWPGVEQLHPDAQAALLSLIYNRGASLSGSRRAEMAAIGPLVAARDYAGIAREIRAMKRLWEGRGLDGLLKRRDDEARLVARAGGEVETDGLVRV